MHNYAIAQKITKSTEKNTVHPYSTSLRCASLLYCDSLRQEISQKSANLVTFKNFKISSTCKSCTIFVQFGKLNGKLNGSAIN
uniref:Uncharacterized protein n=1 Tax=Podoviridae sp. ct53O25 TaxID=2826539 RepID=A0A8S5MC60_9CAUD|nr:MAG TPA: hypothetical protein [Podoviridae sp. ct53O25]